MLPLLDEWNDLSVYDHFMQGSIVRRVWARSRRKMSPQYWYMCVALSSYMSRVPPTRGFNSWNLSANVDTKELSYENFGVLGDWFYNKHIELFRSICLPCLPSEYDSWCANCTAQTSALFTLPPEVLSLIFAQLHDLPHVIALAITCRYLLGVGKAQVLHATRAFHAPWAGCRLVCFGTRMRADDVPARMLTAGEREEMRRWLAAWRLPSGERGGDEDEDEDEDEEEEEEDDAAGGLDGESDDEDGAGGGARERAVSFPDVACGDYRLVFGWVWALARANPAQRVLEAIGEEGRQPPPDARLGEHADDAGPAPVAGAGGPSLVEMERRGRSARVSGRDSELFSALYGSDHWAAAYPSGPRVLCNLSKGEYVREDALPTAHGADVGKPIGWGHVLLARICWSSNPESGMPEAGNEKLCRGPWAGDRVCITSLDALPEPEEGRAWRDVSVEVEDVLSGVWKTESGKKRDSSTGMNITFHPWEICYSRGEK